MFVVAKFTAEILKDIYVIINSMINNVIPPAKKKRKKGKVQNCAVFHIWLNFILGSSR